MTVQHIIDRIIQDAALPKPLEQTCDRLMAGKPDQEVGKVVTTFMATVDVIRKARGIGANMIITHEPTWFSGKDTTDWLASESGKDPVFAAKAKLIEETGVAIWRYHDHMHMKKPDTIYTGILKELGWDQYARKPEIKTSPAGEGIFRDFAGSFQDYYDIPATTLKDLALFFKQKLNIKTIQIIGNEDMPCSRVGILVGGGSLGLEVEEMPMQVMRALNIHVMVCGDITEWTLPAYVNDAAMLGQQRALIIAGHERTEEWGMKYMAEWIPGIIGGIPATFIDAEEPFGYL
jgi:putative NIF3 family GTP cyclohydrolase 1 type 2